MDKITPCLWFDGQAEEAAEFYVGIFEDAKILDVTRFGSAGPGPEGSVLTVSFQLRGQEFLALNGGPQFTFTEAVSFQAFCATQDEERSQRAMAAMLSMSKLDIDAMEGAAAGAQG